MIRKTEEKKRQNGLSAGRVDHGLLRITKNLRGVVGVAAGAAVTVAAAMAKAMAWLRLWLWPWLWPWLSLWLGARGGTVTVR